MPLESNDLVNIHCCPQDLSTLSLYLLRMPHSKIITPQLRPQPQVSGRASATTPLITCGYTGRPKEMIWIELLVLTVPLLVHFPSGVPQKRKEDAPFLRIIHLDKCTHTNWLRDPNIIVFWIHSLSLFPR